MKNYYSIQKASRVFGNKEKLFGFIRDLLNEEYKVFESKQYRGDLVPYHTHAHQEVIVVLKGKMRLIIEEEIVDITEGDILTIEPFAIHLAAFPNTDEEGCHFYLCFPKKA